MGGEMIIPPLFRCPISLDLFQDPVTLCTGQTYDRPCIQKWLSAGNSICPITMQKLNDTTMVPNHTLGHLIHQWLHSHTINTNTIKEILESHETSLQEKLQALDDAIHEASGAHAISLVKLMLELSFRNGQSLALVEKALVCASKLLPFAGTGDLSILRQEVKYTRFLLLLENGSRSVKKSLCLVVEAVAISSCSETKHLCEEKLVRIIVQVIMSGNDEEVVEAGIRAALALSYTESTRGYLVSRGAVGVLISYLCSDCISGGEMAMCTIENMLCVKGAKDEVLNHELGVKGIVKMVFRVSERLLLGSESAVNSLIIICCDSVSGTEMAIQQGVLTQLLLLLQSQCNARTKTKATTLLKLLRST